MALRVLPVLPPLRWGEWPGSGCTVASEVAGVAWVSKEPRPPQKNGAGFSRDAKNSSMLFGAVLIASGASAPPHVLYIMGDDVGW